MIQEEGGALLAGVPAVAVLLFVFSFFEKSFPGFRLGVVEAAKALLCGSAGITTAFETAMMAMFSEVDGRIGFFVCVGSLAVLYLMSMHLAVRATLQLRRSCRERPPPWGLAFGVLLAAGALISTWVSRPNDAWELFLGLAAGVVVAAPLLLIVMLAAVRYRLARTGAAADSVPGRGTADPPGDWSRR
jgi:hypothetical protein